MLCEDSLGVQAALWLQGWPLAAHSWLCSRDL